MPIALLRFIPDRALWHLSFICGEELDGLLGYEDGTLPEKPATEVGCTAQGITLAGLEIPGSPGTQEKLITWAVAHAVFDMRFPKKHDMFGVFMYNHVCGFQTKEPPRLAKVMKVLSK